MVLTTTRVIWRELQKVRVESETAYGSAENMVMVGHYLWVTIQAHRVMDDLLRSQFRQHPEVAPHITLYLFKHRAPIVEVVALKQRVEFQDKTISQMDKTCKEVRLRVDLITDKANHLSNK